MATKKKTEEEIQEKEVVVKKKKTKAAPAKEEVSVETEKDAEIVEIPDDVAEEIVNGETVGESKEQIRRRKRSAISEFAREHDRVLTADGTERNSETVDRFSQALIDLSISAKNRHVLRDRLESVEYFQGYGVVGVLYHGGIKIFIPATKILDKSRTNIRADMTERQLLVSMLNSRLGCELSYVVTDVFAEQRWAVGDHLAANEIMQWRFYINKSPDGEPPVRVGRVVEASVLSVHRYGVVLDVFGFEKYTNVAELTYNRLIHAGREFSVGDKLEVRVKNIEIEDGKVKDVAVSAKDLKSDPLKKALSRLETGSSYIGVVDNIDEHAVFVSIDLDGVKVSVYCPYPKRGVLAGSRVTLRISGVLPEENRAWGIINRVNSI